MGDSCTKASMLAFVRKELLLVLTLVGVVFGLLVGIAVNAGSPTRTTVILLGFPGEILMRLLKMLVLPLIAGSMVSGICQLRTSGSNGAQIAKTTLVYYGVTTVIAVVLGILLVNVIQPGVGHSFDSASTNSSDWRCQPLNVTAAKKESIEAETGDETVDALLGVVRKMVPSNVVKAAVNMNILGVICFAVGFGVMLSGMGEKADGLIGGIEAFNEVIMKMVTAALWLAPPGVASLIAGNLAGSCNPSGLVAALGLFIFNIILGLSLQSFGLALMYFMMTRKNPVRFIKGCSEALVTAFGTDSSSAALPVTLRCCEKLGCSKDVCLFVAPLGATVNMNGTALYEATTVIFLAQVNGVSLGISGTIVVAFTATLAAVGAATIPSAGLVTMIMVLEAVDMEEYVSDIAYILSLIHISEPTRPY
eukprot:TRINITY_DN28042_c0_g1_i2.p1 TRINITY_DN28042_c0_g1~~TRINITY_DN28042_c0_g1_i2.p1  ORF type:complete len:421 (+),score=110.84 TRINITY_DN28042_c0_g1_i2:209-1471(+)